MNTDQKTNLKNERWIAVGAALLAIAILIFTNFGKGQTIRYDCRDAHWHPDVPVEVKKECSRLMYEEWKRRQEETGRKIITT